MLSHLLGLMSYVKALGSVAADRDADLTRIDAVRPTDDDRRVDPVLDMGPVGLPMLH